MAPRVEPIKTDRDWIGAVPGSLANPTLWLFGATVALLALGWAGFLTGVLPAPAAVAVNAVATYLIFTVLHDAMHGTAHRHRAVNAVLGRVAGLPLTIPSPLFRAVHYEHHSHTNDADRDPDLIVSRTPRLLLPLWCLGIVVEYRRAFYGRRLWRTGAERTEAIATDMALLAVIGGAAAAGWLMPLLVLWLLPAALALVLLGFAFDFLPHYPYDTAERYFDTRVYPGRVLNLVLLGQNYHLIHHLWTTIPWYRYQLVFRTVAAELEGRGSRIGWRVRPLPTDVPCLRDVARA
jgi:beta-carotene hydroxylase